MGKSNPSQFSHPIVGGLPILGPSKLLLKVRVHHKPVSINESHYLRRGKPKTRKYIDYQEAWALVLQEHEMNIEKDYKLRVDYIFGFSRVTSDVDNCIKTTQDTFQTFYGFDDKQVYHVRATKILVPKGMEYADVIVRKFI